MTAPIIAVSSWRRRVPTYLGSDTDLYTLGGEYADALGRAGGIPVILPNLPVDSVGAVLDGVDGVLLTGCQDTGDPAPADAARDATEFALLAGARSRGLPVFGICRGLQITNMFFAGTLSAELPETPEHPHAEGAAQLEVRHSVTATAGWLAAALPEHGIVNSIHHQAVDRIGPGLAIAAIAPDGVLEALEAPESNWFLRAVQWHPEKLPGASGREHSDRLLADFLTAASAHAAGRTTAPPRRKEYV
jgi:putative glutamine amidotransferase